MEVEKKNYFWLIVILVVFLLTFGVLVYYIRINGSTTVVNTVSEGKLSLSNSYIFSSPVKAKANGDSIRLTIFILDESGNGVTNRITSLKSTGELVKINDIQPLTDETGKAIFDVLSETAGNYELQAFSEKTALDQKIRVTFE